MQKKFKMATLGCRTNQYETEAFRSQLEAMGWQGAADGEEASLCIVNTCTVTKNADSSSRHEVRRQLLENPNAKVVVTGCAAEQERKAFEEISDRVSIVPNPMKEELVSTLFPEEQVPEFSIKNFEAHTRAFVKVQDGCNSFCTYCIIPYVRGRSTSRPLKDVVREVEGLVANGYKEVVITGINVGDWSEPPLVLADLIRAVDQVEGLKRLRLSSIDPDEVDDNLADAILNGKTTCPSMHIVLQSGSNRVLKRMNRKYTKEIFLETCRKLKKKNPEFTFTTDVIVGFPGETDEDFEETLAVIEEVQFAKVHMFPYSPRNRTRAALYPDRVALNVVRARKNRLLRREEEVSFHLREDFVGKRMWVLTESCGFGHTDNFLPVKILDENIVANELVEVEIISNEPEGLVGRCR